MALRYQSAPWGLTALKEEIGALPVRIDAEFDQKIMARAASGDRAALGTLYDQHASQMLALGCLAQRLGDTLEFDRAKKIITNNRTANQLLAGPPPRKGWEQYYTL